MTRSSTPSKRLAARAHEKAGPRVVLVRDRIDRGGQNVGLQHHAGAAAGRGVIDAAVPVGGKIAQLRQG